MLRNGVFYITKAEFDKLFRTIGYVEGSYEDRAEGITYLRQRSGSLPSSITTVGVEVAIDGTLCLAISICL